MNNNKTYFRRKLPHYQPDNAAFFVTFRLANSLPQEVIVRLKEEQEELVRQFSKLSKNVGQVSNLSQSSKGQLGKLSYNELYNQQKRYFAKFDEYLDKVNTGELYLNDERVAKIVADTIHFLDGKKYDLICYCIMPNHVHIVFSVGQFSKLSKDNIGQVGNLSYNLSPILHTLKLFTAREANKILHRTGAFWQHESYDHIIRDEKELYRIVEYVLNNPVKAGLVSERSEWKWSYAKKFE
jgi:REP element-mobilizing transposase RayT